MAAGTCRAPDTVLLHVRWEEDGRWKLRLQAGGRLALQVRRKLYGPREGPPLNDAGLLWESRAGEHRRAARDQAQAVTAQLRQRGFEHLADASAQPSLPGEATHVFYPRLAIECPCEVEALNDEAAASPETAVVQLASRRAAAGEDGPLRFEVSCLKSSEAFERRLRERAPWLWCLGGAPEHLALLDGGLEALCSAIAASGHCLAAAVGDVRIFRRRTMAAPGYGREGLGQRWATAPRHSEQSAAVLCSGLCGELAQPCPHQVRFGDLGERTWCWVKSLSQEHVEPQVLSVVDVDRGTAQAAKHICIRCPGAVEDAIDLEGIPNGVIIRIGSEGQDDVFERVFEFDYRVEGELALCQDECWFEGGMLLVSLRRVPERRVRLSSRRGSLPAPIETQADMEVFPEAEPEVFPATPREPQGTAGFEVFPMTPMASEALVNTPTVRRSAEGTAGFEVFPLTPTASEASGSADTSPSGDWYFISDFISQLIIPPH